MRPSGTNKTQIFGVDEAEPIPGFAELLEQVQAMVAESGNPDGFDARAWLTNWLQQPVPALGGKQPIAFLVTPKGELLVSNLLRQMQTGAFA